MILLVVLVGDVVSVLAVLDTNNNDDAENNNNDENNNNIKENLFHLTKR